MTDRTDLAEKAAPAAKPRKLWDGALKMVRGENTTQLIEDSVDFTGDEQIS